MNEVMVVTQEQVDIFLNKTLKVVNGSSRDEIAESAQTILDVDAKRVRAYLPAKMAVLRLIKSMAVLGYHYALFRGRDHGDSIVVPVDGTRSTIQTDDGGTVSPVGQTSKKVEFVEELTLFDDESTQKKLESMSKWDVMFDDERNKPKTEDMDGEVNKFIEFGKRYKIRISLEEVEDG